MNDRDKLVELIYKHLPVLGYDMEAVAECLIEDGVVIQKQGEWIYQGDDDNYMYRCSNCRHGVIFRKDTCPSCGVKMKEVK